MRIHILETGVPPSPLEREFEPYPAMFRRILGPVAPHFSFTASATYRGEAAPPVDEFDGLLITGSPAGVYETHDWIAPAKALVLKTADAGKPQVGICFGHQLMASAFGGKVEKSERGWGVGLHQYSVTATRDWMTPAPQRIACSASHQDQVAAPPPGARTLAGSDFCPHAILEYARGPALSLQPHPEFALDFSTALMRRMRGRLPPGLYDSGLASLNGRSDRDLLARWMGAFFISRARR